MERHGRSKHSVNKKSTEICCGRRWHQPEGTSSTFKLALQQMQTWLPTSERQTPLSFSGEPSPAQFANFLHYLQEEGGNDNKNLLVGQERMESTQHQPCQLKGWYLGHYFLNTSYSSPTHTLLFGLHRSIICIIVDLVLCMRRYC